MNVSAWSIRNPIPAILLFGAELFTKATPVIDASALLSGFFAARRNQRERERQQVAP